MYIGLLNIHKSPGVTSRQVVDCVQRLVRPAKAGHAGTLDPLATGVLVVCVGQATRLIEYVQQSSKRYTGTFLLGRASDTEDIEGVVTELRDPPRPTRKQIEEAAARLSGEIQQRPPAYSALKIAGRRAYDLARSGQRVELAPRPVRVDGIDIVSYAYPELVLDIRCGAGTYVRSLGRDVAESLGTAAVMSALVRTEIGSFRLEDACPVDELTRETLSRWLLPPRRAVAHMAARTLTESEVGRISCGLPIAAMGEALAAADTELAGCDASGELVAILATRQGELWPSINLRAEIDRRWNCRTGGVNLPSDS